MNLEDAYQLALRVTDEIGIVEGIIMADPPYNKGSYVVQILTNELTPRVIRLGPDKEEASAAMKEAEARFN